MIYMIGHSLKRLFREGSKSLSVPIIAFVLIILINLLGAIRGWLEDQYEDTLDNFPIEVVISDLTATETDNLNIDMGFIQFFVDPDITFSLMEQTNDLTMKRALDVHLPESNQHALLIGVTNKKADALINPAYGAEVTFYDGYDESVFHSKGPVCLVTEDLHNIVNNGKITVTVSAETEDEYIYDESVHWDYVYDDENKMVWIPYRYIYNEETNSFNRIHVDPEDTYEFIPGGVFTQDVELIVIGTIHAAGVNTIFAPFWSVNGFIEDLVGFEPVTDSLSLLVADNRQLSDFKWNASMTFSRVRPVQDTRPFAMMVFDSEFYETLEPLRQNIILIDVATPFIYIISIAIGFLTSVLLTRRRNAEFAIMRSVGVSKVIVFISALVEQALMSLFGAALGFAFVALIWGYTSLMRPGVFLGCYLLGAVIAARSAAGTDVMKVLRDRKE